MSFAQYLNYRESGIEWMGKIPSHWATDRFKHQVVLVTRKTDQKENLVGLENVEGWTGRLVGSSTEYEGNAVAFLPGDILFGKLRPYLAKVYLADSPGGAVGDFFVLRPVRGIDSRYLRWLTHTREFIDTVDGSTFGSKMPRASWEFLGAMTIVVPPLEEQARIADFLDRETAKIDALIAEQERLVELLKEKGSAVISRAVSKGLSLDRALKSSGVDWLGDIPYAWRTVQLGMVSDVVRGGSPRPAGDPRFFGGDFVPWVTVGEITKDERMYLDKTHTCLTEEGAKRSSRFPAGTVIYSNSGATLGVPKIMTIDACANDGVVAFLNLNKEVSPEFLYYCLSSLTEHIRQKVKQGSGQPNLNTDIVRAIRVALPPLDEQRVICEELGRRVVELENLRTDVAKTVRLLQERRRALVSAAVTGQIDVRSAVQP